MQDQTAVGTVRSSVYPQPIENYSGEGSETGIAFYQFYIHQDQMYPL
jgi:hypothetical protein